MTRTSWWRSLAWLAGWGMVGGVATAGAQPAPFATGLSAPTKLLAVETGFVIVAEAGDGINTGRISVLDRDGNRATLIEGLPSGPQPPGGDPSGPSGLLLRGNNLFIAIGAGNAAVNGPVPGTEIPNPAPASPILSSVLALEFDPGATTSEGGFVLAREDHDRLAAGEEVKLRNAAGEQIEIRLVVNFPDHTSNPLPHFPANVRLSNPFALEGGDTHLDVADASQNAIRRVDIYRGTARDLVVFPPQPNTLPLGPPVVDAVPTAVRSLDSHLIVSFLTGFPFGPGAASIHRVAPDSGTDEVLIAGLQMVTDVLPVRRGSDVWYLVLEHSVDPLAGGTGRLLRFDSPTAEPQVLAEGLVGPAGMAFDPNDVDSVLVTELFAGRVTRVRFQ